MSTRNLSIKVEVDGGAKIENVCREAIELANRVGITVDFVFNGVTCMAAPGGSAVALKGNWETALEQKTQYKFANSYPNPPLQTDQQPPAPSPIKIRVNIGTLDTGGERGKPHQYELVSSHPIPTDKLPGLSKVVEGFVNGEGLHVYDDGSWDFVYESGGKNSGLDLPKDFVNWGKVKYVVPSEKAYDGERLNRYVNDEASQWAVGVDPFRANLEWETNDGKGRVIMKRDPEGQYLVAKYQGRPQSDFEKQVKETMDYFGKNILCEECGEIGKHKENCPTQIQETSILPEAISLLSNYVSMHRMKVPPPYNAMDEQATELIKRYNDNEKGFLWTDELVCEFTSWSLTKSPTFQGRYSDIEQFKKFKATGATLDGKFARTTTPATAAPASPVQEGGKDIIEVEVYRNQRPNNDLVVKLSKPVSGEMFAQIKPTLEKILNNKSTICGNCGFDSALHIAPDFKCPK